MIYQSGILHPAYGTWNLYPPPRLGKDVGYQHSIHRIISKKIEQFSPLYLFLYLNPSFHRSINLSFYFLCTKFHKAANAHPIFNFINHGRKGKKINDNKRNYRNSMDDIKKKY